MAQERTARETALEILLAVEERGAFSNLALHEHLDRSGLDIRDRGLVTELVYGTIQRQYTLDWILGRLVKKGPDSLERWVHQLLRLGLYQLRYLDKIPSRAAVHETVRIANLRGHRGISGLINGVLRSYVRREREFNLKPDGSVRSLALVHSFPEWMVKRLIDSYGPGTAADILASLNRRPHVSLRVNPLQADPARVANALTQSFPGAEVVPSEVVAQAFTVRGAGNPALHPGFARGWYTIQDESSMLVAEAVDPQPGQRVLDGCAAPGGKTTHMAERMGDEGFLLACDVHPHKVGLIEENVRRLSLSIVQAREADLRSLPEEGEDASFDCVLLDAPCSGWGVIRRKPEIKWAREAEAVEELSRLQRELLHAAARMVKPGGILVYSTCTMEPRENEEQVDAFLGNHPDFTADPTLLERFSAKVRDQALHRGAGIQILPHHFESDGFFIARMVKKG
ncbi:16S rRNA (cytosine(967)-C(5))-methyltransferase RsmB [Desmospora profundinema]|uniref:16S rRNA (cytosine(967)-C(5))-methyltransferase n=1 Tax=Desmospora profundinema TaxID=1571184 RepID=A0ABU1IR10_9BACL|nr:16S rRNA (cytosine(967)-C(5))-methyltransferase RsmB [Desmospora profundinema]MDR6227232.1 16S rRNA (cytosine967-C5)-methyltransferase [Desmospora profundinema]